MTRLPADLLPALPGHVRPDQLPTLPSWFPLDRSPSEEDPNPRPYTPEERARLRHAQAVKEACTGPFDGQRLAVAFNERQGPPETFVPFEHQHVRYRLDRKASSDHRLRYRYDPTSAIHAEAMKAVTEAYAEAGRDYVVLAREEDSHDRTAPQL